jgi:hypothetical protein
MPASRDMRGSQAPDLSKVRRYHTLAAKEHRRADKLKWRARALSEMWRVMGWGTYPGDAEQQERLL